MTDYLVRVVHEEKQHREELRKMGLKMEME